MKRIFLLPLLLLASFPAVARLGETRPQLIERLGKVWTEYDQLASAHGHSFVIGRLVAFQKDGWTVECLMVSNHCERITYRKGGEWTEEQFKLLLSNNSSTNAWQELVPKTPNKLFRAWKRADATVAEYNFVKGFTITSPAFFQEKKRLEDEALKRSQKLPSL